jgi:hypothetical protein
VAYNVIVNVTVSNTRTSMEPFRMPLHQGAAGPLCRLMAVLLMILGCVETPHAASYYVDNANGSDANSGTSASAAWQSLSKVNGVTFQPGDEINFKRGSIWIGALQVKSSGTSASPITYRAYGTGPAPQIKNPGVYYGADINITGAWNIVQEFLLTDAHEAGIDIAARADRNIVRNNEIMQTGTGVTTRGQYNLITGNYVHDLALIVNTATPNRDDYGAVCFWFYAGNNELSYNRGVNCRAPSYDFGYDGGFVEIFSEGIATDNLYIHHNYAEKTNGFFELGASSNGSAQNTRVAYNVIVNVTARGSGTSVCFNAGSFSITMGAFRFENNTFLSQSGHPDAHRVFGCRSDLTFLQLRNNIFYSDIQIADNSTFTHTYNLYYMVNMVSGSGVGYGLSSGERTGNPSFVDPGVGNLGLQAVSPAIDGGMSLGYTKDIEGNPVPQGLAPDFGAREFDPAASQAPTASSNPQDSGGALDRRSSH